ncbi:hypothetical protein O9K51_07209 [Purpureocillium lavendulum]|uniref:Polyketide synthase n=1 Tax=Purpureocillium lavendulum TaxID=1247861 RepID=A0AB34FKT4_9HYPO|nr:hypothetical protein O9K51_07209 [Purpureocillium lavendulum]
MDPQHRLLLEIAYEAFQNGGISLDSLSSSNTGVFVGQWSTDYHDIETRDIDSPPFSLVTGTGAALSSNRVSHHFNLHGPSFTIDTGCSSSLVALHQAVQSLRSGESAQCFVGGVNLLLDPHRFAYQGNLQMLSEEGRCYCFDSRANGYGRGEGCVGMMLKPLSAALRDGNHVRAVIRNSVVNQDGRTPGLTVPSAAAQEEAILKTYQQAGLELDVDYVEAHGTGTRIGDPIEASAIAAVLTKDKPPSYRLPVGSLKGNIGHTEAAAGLAGVLKAVLMLEHNMIPPQANYMRNNPDINLAGLKLRIPVELERQQLQRISVNSGEIAAAYAARAVSFENALASAYFRGRSVDELLTARPDIVGAMLAIGSDPATVNDYLSEVDPGFGSLEIACFNSHRSTTVSGDSIAVDRLKTILDTHGVVNTKLTTRGVAYHSHHMRLASQRYRAALLTLDAGPLEPEPSTVRMFSSVTGAEDNMRMTTNADYWVKNLLQPVLFSQACQRMLQQDGGHTVDMVVEVGPHSQLRGPVNHTLKSMRESHSHIAYASLLKKGVNAEVSLLECLGQMDEQSAMSAVNQLNGLGREGSGRLLADLPPYPFDHDRIFWHETRISKDYRLRQFLPHELLGTLCLDVNWLEPRWRQFVSVKRSPWLRSHIVLGQIVFPAAAYVTMATQAIQQHAQSTRSKARVESASLRNVCFGKGLVLPEDGSDVELLLALRPEARTARESSHSWSEFRIFTTISGKWTEHCRGLVTAETREVDAIVGDMLSAHASHVNAGCIREAVPQEFYNLGHGVGIDWHSPFNNISNFRTGMDACVATARVLDLPVLSGGTDDILHPAMLDSCLFHGLAAVELCGNELKSALVPTFIQELRIACQPPLAPGSKLVSTSTRNPDDSSCHVGIQHVQEQGQTSWILEARGVRTARLAGNTPMDKISRNICHRVEWVAYTDAWMAEHRNLTCKSVVSAASVVDQNNFLHALALYYVQRAISGLSMCDIPSGHYRHFFAWMQSFAGSAPRASMLPESSAGLDTGSMGEAMRRVGPRLTDILTQKVDPLSVLLPDNLLARLYHSRPCNRCVEQMAEYCHALGRQTPNLRILEVGAGTGSATLPVIRALCDRGGRFVQKYDFTDVSPGFFEASKKHLGDFAEVVDFGVLDVERSGKEQGFEEASYDLIIASNVIHATRHISDSLANIRSLLKPGGRLLLMELTKPLSHYNVIFGTFEGWWAGFDEGRQTSPLLSRPEWISRLQLAGFCKPEKLFEDYPEGDGGSIDVFVAKVPLDPGPGEQIPVHLVSSPAAPIGSGELDLLRRACPEAEIASQCLTTPSPGANIAAILPEVAELLCLRSDAICWESFQHWVLAARAVIFISRGQFKSTESAYGGLWAGLARCLRSEKADTPIVTLDIEASTSSVFEKLSKVFPVLIRTLLPNSFSQPSKEENELAERNGQLMESAEPEAAPFLGPGRVLMAELGTLGMLDSIRWKDDGRAKSLGPDDVRLELRAASVNFKDVLIATGQLDGVTEMRNDCSGIVLEVGTNMRERFKPGDAVYALPSSSYSNYPVVHGDCCDIIPDGMSFEEAASIPVVWTTVFYALVEVGRLAKSERILIHSAAGAIGQAAVMLAQYIGAEIFVTVGNPGKRKLLQDTYGIHPDHIFSSRNVDFYDSIRLKTDGYGVDVVLNSLSDDKFRNSCNLLAPFGRFLEIGKKDILNDALMPMGFLLKNITFACVDLVSEIEAASRLIQSGKHTGKLILKVHDNQSVKALPPLPSRAQLRADATYIVVGGFGGLGRAIMRWMAEHGAKHILSVSRSGGGDKHSVALIDELTAKGVQITAKQCDISAADEVRALVQEVDQQGLAPIRGLIQSAMVLQDSLFESMNEDQWRRALAPKVRGTMNLHNSLTRTNVDFFIALSSAVALRGDVSQSNYAAACSFQDALMTHRTSIGMPSYSINRQDFGARV